MTLLPSRQTYISAFSAAILGLTVLPVTLATAGEIMASSPDCLSTGCDLAQTRSIRHGEKRLAGGLPANPVILLTEANLALVDADRLTPSPKIGMTLRMVHCSGTQACQIAWLECTPLPGPANQLKCSEAK